ncbi:MAG: PAS domain S-box protein [Spartobacteria bacterium]|nr:PAS domain S-box protein [Spartobacteria bacterium]
MNKKNTEGKCADCGWGGIGFADIPPLLIAKWQADANLLAELADIPVALVMKTEDEYMEVAVSSNTPGNPYHAGDKEKWYGLYCETVIKSQQQLAVVNALKDPHWDHNPDIKLGMIAYLGLPVNFPGGKPYGTLCVLDNKERLFTDREKRILAHFQTAIEADLQLLEQQVKTEHRQAELRVSEEHLKVTLRSIGDGVIACDLEGRITSLNIVAETLTGWTSAEAAGRPLEEVFRIINAHTREAVDNPVARTLRNGLIVGLANHTVLIARDGTEYQVADSCAPIRDADGLVRGAVLVFRDVTGEYGRREDLHIKDMALATASNAIAMADLDGLLSYVNTSFVKHWGYQDAAEVIGRPATEFWRTPDEAVKVVEVLKERGAWSGEMVAARQDHSYFPVEVSASLVADPDGRPLCMMASFSDITERKRAEEALREANLQLEHTARQALELAEKAEAANVAKSQFLTTMSHELRTPLNPILGFTELLDAAPNLTEQQRSWVGIVRQRGRDLLNLISAVLDLSKIEANRIVLQPAPLALRPIVSDMIASITPMADEKNLRVEYEVAPDVPEFLVADGLRLRQIILNLLNNAIKFTLTGCISLRVQHGRETRMERRPKEDEIALLFRIQDTGIGIPSDRQAVIFDRFTQADPSHAVDYGGGAGLGLAIASRLVQLMGGKMWVESAPGEGSAFFFTILAGVDKNASTTDEARGAAAPSSGRSLRVLIVEDDPGSLTLAESAMYRAGHTFLSAKNGEEALALAKAEPFDAVLMDIEMPVMDGLTATRMMRDPQTGIKNPNLPIIAMTADALPGDRERCLAAGMDDYITKPLSPQALNAMLDNCCSAS